MSSKKKLKPWTEVYPQGTPMGDEEQRFFIALSRSKKYIFKSVSAIAHEANLTKERVEEIIDKYYKTGMVIPDPKSEEQWGYWQRVPEDLLPKEYLSIADTDKKKRIDKAKQ